MVFKVRVCNENGLVFGSKHFLLIDPERKSNAKNVIITHAHSDHVKLNNESSFIMSEPTHELVKTRYKSVKNLKKLKFNKRFCLENFQISLHNSGHILGGSQVLIEASKSVLFSSDFKLQDSLVLKGAKPLKADTLIVESTFGLPCFDFPERETVYKEIGKWIKQNVSKNRFVLLSGYALGKAQELTAIVNNYSAETPIVHESIYELNKVYKKFKVKLGKFLKLNHNLKESNVLIMPSSLVDAHLLQALEVSTGKKVVSAMATGWHYRSFYNKIFPLSDHADFKQLMQFVKDTEPKLVLTTHGYATEFANYVKRRLKIPARPLGQKGQSTIAEFFH